MFVFCQYNQDLKGQNKTRKKERKMFAFCQCNQDDKCKKIH